MSDPNVPEIDSPERAEAWGEGFVEEPESEPKPTREMLRSRRKREVRSRTIGRAHEGSGRYLLPALRAETAAILLDAGSPQRPRTRSDCADVPRPCPWVTCAHHLFLEVAKAGGITFRFPDLEPDEMPANRSCVLDVADDGGLTLEATGEALNVTRERVRQIEVKAAAKILARAPKALLDHAPGPSRVHLRVVDGEVDGTFDVGWEAAAERRDLEGGGPCPE